MDVTQDIATWLRNHGLPKVMAKRAGKSIALSIEVPKLNVTAAFESTSKADLKECFDAVQALSDFANMVAATYAISALKTNKSK